MTNENVVDEGIINKIKALYAKAASTDSMEEAETATAMATKLLIKYNLDLSKIDLKTEAEKKASIIKDYHHLGGEQKRHESEWVAKLYMQIAKYNLCRAFSAGERNSGVNYNPGYVLIIGEPQNIELVKFIVGQVVYQIRRLEPLAWKSYYGIEKRNAFRRGFFDGAAIGVGTKLYHERQEMEAAKSGEAQEMGLMVISKDALVNNYISENITFKAGRSTKGLSSADGKTLGFEAGRNITINKYGIPNKTKGLN